MNFKEFYKLINENNQGSTKVSYSEFEKQLENKIL